MTFMLSRSISSLPLSESSLKALERSGFKTIADLGSLTAEQLSDELKIPSFLCEEILRVTKRTSYPLSQCATSLLDATCSTFPISKSVDALIGQGGLPRGCVLELSGPPGSPKEHAIIELVRSVITAKEEVLFLDAQNMILPSTLKTALKGSLDRIHYVKCASLVDLMGFMYNLPCLLDEYPKSSLLVLNTLSFLIHSAPLNSVAKASMLEQLKTIITKVCASRHLTISVTGQLATKMIIKDGSNTDPNAEKLAVMSPQLGDSYLPSSKSFRLVFIPDSPRMGVIRLLASPSRSASSLKTDIVQEPYEMVDGQLRSPIAKTSVV